MDDSPESQEKKRGRNPPVEHQFKKGQSGNPKGRPKGPSLVGALRKVLTDAGGEAALEDLAKTWFAHAKKGNPVLFKELLERLDGKVAQKTETELTGRDGGPVEFREWSTAEVYDRFLRVVVDEKAVPSNGNGNGSANGNGNGHVGPS